MNVFFEEINGKLKLLVCMWFPPFLLFMHFSSLPFAGYLFHFATVAINKKIVEDGINVFEQKKSSWIT